MELTVRTMHLDFPEGDCLASINHNVQKILWDTLRLTSMRTYIVCTAPYTPTLLTSNEVNAALSLLNLVYDEPTDL